MSGRHYAGHLRRAPANSSAHKIALRIDLAPICTVNVARPELGREAIAVRVEDEERVVADGLEVAIIGGLLLRPVDWALGAVDIESHPPPGSLSYPNSKDRSRGARPAVRRDVCRQRRRPDGERGVEDRAVRLVRRGPELAAVCLDDRAAYRQPHAHASGLGRAVSREQPVALVPVSADPEVAARPPTQ